MRWRTVAETSSLTTTTAKMAISITLTACHWNRLIEELSRMPKLPVYQASLYRAARFPDNNSARRLTA